MLPHLVSRCSKLTACVAAGALFAPALFAQQDAPPVDVGQLLQALRTIREQQTTQLKSKKLTTAQQISAAAASPEKAVALWEEGVRATQFEGAGHETTQFRAWREGEGEAFKEREVQNALRLYFTWLSLTIQRSSGTEVKDLLQPVINYTKELAVDQTNIEMLQDAIKREKEMAAARPVRGPKKATDDGIKKTHDSILNRPLGGSVVVQWMKLADWVAVDKWEHTPGNLDGIYKNIILPEFRSLRDPRLLDYWDLKLRKEGEAATRSRLSFEVDKFNTIRMPSLLFSKATDTALIGQKNRAVTEMFSLIKKYPAHPEAAEWISKLEEMLAPPPPPPAPAAVEPSTGAATAAPAPAAAPPAAGTAPR